MQPFTIKYAPKSAKEILGQDESLKKLSEFIKNFSNQKNKAALLYGPPGTGKTSAAYALAEELDLEIIEINASDVRNADQIEQIIGAATKQQSLFMKQKLILIDEIDGLSGTKDRGGLPTIIKIIESTSFPIILTIANPFDNKFSKIRKKTDMIEFAPLHYLAIFEILKNICEKENIIYEEDVLKGLARRAGSDARAAINDLETLSIETSEITKQSLEDLSERNKMDTMLNALFKVFKTTDPKIAITAFDTVAEDVDQRFLWIDENLPAEYTKPEERAAAYDKLSKADVFRRRIRRWQHWRFLIYINALISAGIAVSKKERYPHTIKYKPTGRLLKIWWANQKTAKKKAISEKIAERTHTSSKRVQKDVFPYFHATFKNNKQFQDKVTEELELSKEEVEWLKK